MLKFLKTFSVLAFFFLSTEVLSQSHKDWSYNLNIYEVNTRQYTLAGTFGAFATHLDRLQEMGVGIIWLMPIHPIGQQNRLGSLGSPYSVKDYLQVNPEYGSLAQFKDLVNMIHARGMYVIIDWVANHTAWDNVLTTTHPEWYVTDNNGNFTSPPGTNWSDVIQLDYSQQGLRDYMIDAMIYWINETGIDGFRCDAVSFMPGDFWAAAIPALKAVKPEILMLAEDDGPQYQSLGFDMSYAWGLHGFGHGVLKNIVNGSANAYTLENYLNTELAVYNPDHYRMYFTSNHDENAWHGTVFEQFGEAAETFAVLTATINDMQLVYGGQEAGLNKRLAFFDKDRIIWQQHPFMDLYTTLFHLKRNNRALWNGESGGQLQRIDTGNANVMFAFKREKENDRLLGIFNLSASFNGSSLQDSLVYGNYTDVFSGDSINISQSTNFVLPGWGYRLFQQVETVSGIAEDERFPVDFFLDQNYPNPFNPVTKIGIRNSEFGFIELTIYDVSGRLIRTLLNEHRSAGNHLVQWDATDNFGQQVGSGIYFYRLRVNGFQQVRKMMLIR